MVRDIDYREELLKWNYNQILLRKKYNETPPGLSEQQAEEQIAYWKNEKKRFDKDRVISIIPMELPQKEILVGREKEIEDIHAALCDGNRNIFLYGIGGIGKSALARNCMHQFRQEYDLILYMSVSGNIQNLFGDDFSLKITNMTYRQEKYGNRRQYFFQKLNVLLEQAKNEKILIVIDDFNLISDKDFGKILEIPCDKIFTSRLNPSVWEKFEEESAGTKIWSKEIIALPENKIKDLIDLYLGVTIPDKVAYNKLLEYAENINRHTLKIKLAAGNFESDFLNAEWEGKSLLACFPLKKAERDVLMYFTLIPVGGIRRDLFQTVIGTEDKIIESLKKYLLLQSLYEETTGVEILSLHPIVAEEVIKTYKPSVNNCSAYIRKWGEYMDGTTNGVITWERKYEENRQLEPFIFSLVKAFPKPAPWLALAFEEVATFLWIQQYYKEAQNYAIKIYQEVLDYYGEDNAITGREALRVAAAYYNALDFDNANFWYKHSYTLFINMSHRTDEMNKQLLILYTKLMRMERYNKNFALGNAYFEEGKSLCSMCLASTKTSKSTRKEAETVYCYLLLELAKSYYEQNRFEDANECYLEIEKRLVIFGEESYRQNEFLEFYSNLLVKQENYEEAKNIEIQILNTTIQFRGELYKDTLSRRENLGDIYLACNEKKAARKEYEKVLIVLQREYKEQLEWLERISHKIMKCR